MKLELHNFSKNFGDIYVIKNMNLKIERGQMLALLGPSGCGKSTTLLAICGIHRIDGGYLLFGERDVTDVPSQKRNVGVVFQNYALYPHMSVYDNIAFPLKVQKTSVDELDRRVRKFAELVRIESLLNRRPAHLSGGQQQRVALARALVREPDFLLLDEPLANLDAKLRLEMRSEIRRLQQETGLTAVLVTHDQVEAMSICDKIAIMNNGKIVQIDQPKDMYKSPVDKFVAGFLGNPPISFVDRSTLPLELGKNTIEVGIRPEHFGPQFGTGLQGKVHFVEAQGREELVEVALPSGEIVRSVQPSNAGFYKGMDIDWGFDENHLLFFDRAGTRI